MKHVVHVETEKGGRGGVNMRHVVHYEGLGVGGA